MRNWISRVGCIFAAVLIMAPHAAAHAEEKITLSELRESCQQGWHETYDSHGRTIDIDLEILIPDADCFPVVYADPLQKTGEHSGAEVSTVNNHVEEWRSEGILRVDYPDSGVRRAAQKEHPEAVLPVDIINTLLSGKLLNLKPTSPMHITIQPQ